MFICACFLAHDGQSCTIGIHASIALSIVQIDAQNQALWCGPIVGLMKVVVTFGLVMKFKIMKITQS